MKKTTKYRKNKMKFALMVPLLMLLLAACFSPWAGETDETQLTIAFGTAGRLAVTEQELSGLNFEVILDGPGGRRTETFSGSTTATLRVLPGKHHIIVRGIGVTPPIYTGFPDTMLRVWGSYEATVQPGQNNHANIAIATAVEVANWAQLNTAITLADTSGRKEFIVFANNFQSGTPTTITIGADRDLIFLAETPVIVDMLAANNITVGASAKLTLGQNGIVGPLTFDGANRAASTPMINIAAGGDLVMNDGIVLQNRFSSGSAGAVNSNGTFTMNGGTISGNRSTQGGGVQVSGNIFTMNGGMITMNTATTQGGGVFVGPVGEFIMTGGTIHNNEAPNGGGVRVNGLFTMEGSAVISNNTATSGGGGGVRFANGGSVTPVFEMRGNAIIMNNRALGTGNDAVGGGVYCSTTGSIFFGMLENARVTGNSATRGGGGVFGYANATSSLGSLISQLYMYDNARIDGNTTTSENADSDIGGAGVGILGVNNVRLSFSMRGNAEVSGNRGNGNSRGGGVFVSRSTPLGASSSASLQLMDNTRIHNNHAVDGGGVFIGRGSLNMTGGVISGNTATWGGGVRFQQPAANASFTKSGGIIYGNDASAGLRNTADNNTSGHAAFTVVNNRYRNSTAGQNDNASGVGDTSFFTNN